MGLTDKPDANLRATTPNDFAICHKPIKLNQKLERVRWMAVAICPETGARFGNVADHARESHVAPIVGDNASFESPAARRDPSLI